MNKKEAKEAITKLTIYFTKHLSDKKARIEVIDSLMQLLELLDHIE